jgi:hypothetical protein
MAPASTTGLFENRARATLENTGQISTALICGGSVETGLWSLVDGQSANLAPAIEFGLYLALASLGSTIEWYDFFLYGTASALVFGDLFFPTFSPLVGTVEVARFAAQVIGVPGVTRTSTLSDAVQQYSRLSRERRSRHSRRAASRPAHAPPAAKPPHRLALR